MVGIRLSRLPQYPIFLPSRIAAPEPDPFTPGQLRFKYPSGARGRQ
jgi:hypothetical protein